MAHVVGSNRDDISFWIDIIDGYTVVQQKVFGVICFKPSVYYFEHLTKHTSPR